MNREEVIKARDIYLAKLSEDLQERHPHAINFYQDPANTDTSNIPAWSVKKNSRKGLTPSKAIITDDQLRHLLRRTTPGIAPSVYKEFQGKNTEEIIDSLLTEENLDEPVNNYEVNGIVDPNVALGESFADASFNNDIEGQRIVSLKGWFINELLQPTTSMHSTMWLFWHNHLVTELWGIFQGKFCYKYLKMLHDLSFGNFKEMIYRISIDPCMLIYLNGIVNNKDAPDENFGRELQELFTIGKGPDANYTEGDVQAAARVMTGWNVNWEQGEPVFYDFFHETADKQFSEFYGNKLIEGKSGQAGRDELDEMIDMIFDTNEVAAFIVRKLYTFFVFASIDDWTEENIIQPLATTFRNNDYTIKPVLRELFNSEHFMDEVNYGAIIKTPVDSLIGWWRGMEIQYPFDPETEITEKFLVHNNIMWNMASWGMEIGDPPNVAGWPAFYQYPTYDKTWITTSTITRRISIIDAFLAWGFWYKDGGKVEFDPLEYAKSLENPGDPNALIRDTEKLFLGLSMDEAVFNGIKSTLLSGQSEDYYWTNAWNAYIADETNEVNKNVVLYRLITCLQRIFHLSEYQLK